MNQEEEANPNSVPRYRVVPLNVEMRVKMKTTCACLVLRIHHSGLQILLVSNDGKQYGLPKGRPNPREDLQMAALRETKEETGIEVKPLRFAFLKRGIICWYASPKNNGKPKTQHDELVDARYFSIDELPCLKKRENKLIRSHIAKFLRSSVLQ